MVNRIKGKLKRYKCPRCKNLVEVIALADCSGLMTDRSPTKFMPCPACGEIICVEQVES